MPALGLCSGHSLGCSEVAKLGFIPLRDALGVRLLSPWSDAWVLQPVPVPTRVTALQKTEPVKHGAAGGYLYSVKYAGLPRRAAGSLLR